MTSLPAPRLPPPLLLLLLPPPSRCCRRCCSCHQAVSAAAAAVLCRRANLAMVNHQLRQACTDHAAQWWHVDEKVIYIDYPYQADSLLTFLKSVEGKLQIPSVFFDTSLKLRQAELLTALVDACPLLEKVHLVLSDMAANGDRDLQALKKLTGIKALTLRYTHLRGGVLKCA
jgi:hypothetical protein